jgi:hypothetical protein
LSEERDKIVAGQLALSAALAEIGEAPLGSNPDLIEDVPYLEVFPTYVAFREGAAPFTFVLGSELQMDVGPFSEVLVLDVDVSADELRDSLVRVLRSHVDVTVGRIWATVTLTDSNGQEWRKLRVARTAEARALTTRSWAPFARA